MSDDDQALAAAYWTYARLSKGDRTDRRVAVEEWFWAWERVEERVDADGPAAVPLLVVLAKAAPEREAAYIGAGPIENLLGKWGIEAIDALEEAARKNPGFAQTFRSVYWPSNLSEQDIERLRKFV